MRTGSSTHEDTPKTFTFTFIVPTNYAWEKVKQDFSTAFLRRHLIVSERDYTIEHEQVVEPSLRSTKKTVETEASNCGNHIKINIIAKIIQN